MTLSQFMASVPKVIYHPDEGPGILEIIAYQPTMKGACYRHENSKCTGTQYGATWQEVHNKMIDYLKLLEKYNR